IEHAARNVDPTTTDGRLQRRSADGAGARASVKRKQNKPRNMLPRAPARRLALLYLTVAPGGPQQPRRLFASEPPLARRRGLGQNHLDDRGAQPFPTVVIDCGTEIFKFTSSRRAGAAMFNIITAHLTVDVRKDLVAKISQQGCNPLCRLSRPGMFRRYIAAIER